MVVRPKGDYAGTMTKTFRIVPKGTRISGKVTPKSKSFTVRWKKQTKQTTGYQVQYSTSRKFTKKTTVTKTVRKNTAAKLTVRKLKAKKKYYVRVRTYKEIRGEKYCSGWSKSFGVTTRK